MKYESYFVKGVIHTMKKCISLFIVLITVISMLSVPSALAQEPPSADEPQIIVYEDGSYLVITREPSNAQVASTAKTTTETHTKTATYYSQSGDVEWKVEVVGTFTYDGTTATCTTAICTASIYNKKWYVVSKSASKSKNVAYGYAVMGYKTLGVTVDKKTCNLALTCDPNGNFS